MSRLCLSSSSLLPHAIVHFPLTKQTGSVVMCPSFTTLSSYLLPLSLPYIFYLSLFTICTFPLFPLPPFFFLPHFRPSFVPSPHPPSSSSFSLSLPSLPPLFNYSSLELSVAYSAYYACPSLHPPLSPQVSAGASTLLSLSFIHFLHLILVNTQTLYLNNL